MSAAILSLAFPTLGCMIALILYHCVEQERKRTKVLGHKYALRAIRDELFRFVARGQMDPRGAVFGILVSSIDAVIEASDDLGIELYPVARVLLDDENARGTTAAREQRLPKTLPEQEALVFDRLRKKIGRETLEIIKCNSTLARFTFVGSRLQARDRDGRSTRAVSLRDVAGALANLAGHLPSTNRGTMCANVPTHMAPSPSSSV